MDATSKLPSDKIMSKIYKNHVFKRPTKHWQLLIVISLFTAFAASTGAYFTGKSWLSEGRYLQSIDIEQIEVLRLMPALKDLKEQTEGAFTLSSNLFGNLKKADDLLRSMGNVALVSANKANKGANLASSKNIESPAPPAGVTEVRGSTREDAHVGLIKLSENPLLAFFQKMDSKLMKAIFGTPYKYLEMVEGEGISNAPNTIKAADIDDLFREVKVAETAISMILSQEINLAGLDILAKSVNQLAPEKSLGKLVNAADRSPQTKYAESLDEYVRANTEWQKNITSASTAADLQKALVAVIDQKVLLQIEAGKKTSGKTNLKRIPIQAKAGDSPWDTKLPQEALSALKTFSTNFQIVRQFVAERQSFSAILPKTTQVTSLFDFKTAGGFLGLTLVSILSLLGVGLGLTGFLFANQANMNATKAHEGSFVAPTETMRPIDLGLVKSPQVDVKEALHKIEPQLDQSSRDDADLLKRLSVAEAAAGSGEIIQHIKGKIFFIESRLKTLGQLTLKLRHSVNTLQDKSIQMRSGDFEGTNDSYVANVGSSRSGPLEQLQDAFFAIKQQGVRLYLAILDNQSGKQLALETEQLNLLVERVEAALSKIRTTLASSLDQVADSRGVAAQVDFEVLELLNMDAKQVVRDLELWQVEFSGLSQEFIDLKREVSV